MPSVVREVGLGGREFVDQHGIAWDGENWWIAGNNTDALYRTDGDFQTVEKIDLGIVPRGIEVIEGEIWISAFGKPDPTPGIHRVDPSGAIAESVVPFTITQRDTVNEFPLKFEGIGWDGENFIAPGPPSNKPPIPYLTRVRRDGALMDYTALPSTAGTDFNGTTVFADHIWIADDNDDKIHIFDMNFNKVGDFDAPGWPWGVAWDGTHLAVSHRGEPQTVDKVEFWDVSDVQLSVGSAPGGAGRAATFGGGVAVGFLARRFL